MPAVDGPMMTRIRCGTCETYEILANLVILLERDEGNEKEKEKTHFVSNASRRKTKEGGRLRIESRERYLEIAAEEEARQASGDIPPAPKGA